MNRYNTYIITIQKTIRGFLIRKKLKASCPDYCKKYWNFIKYPMMINEFNKIVENYFDEQAPSPFISYVSNVAKEVSNQEGLELRGSRSFEKIEKKEKNEKIEKIVFFCLEKPIFEPVNFFMHRLKEKWIGQPEVLMQVKKKYLIRIDKEPDVKECKIRSKVIVDCLSLGFVSRNEYSVVMNKPLCELCFDENRTELGFFKRVDEMRKDSAEDENIEQLSDTAKNDKHEFLEELKNAGITEKNKKSEVKRKRILEEIEDTPVKQPKSYKKIEKTPDKYQKAFSKNEKTPDKLKSLRKHNKTPEKLQKTPEKHQKTPEKHQKFPEKYKELQNPIEKSHKTNELPKINPTTKLKNKTPESRSSSIESASNLIERLTKDYQINLDSLSSSIVSSKDKPEKAYFKIRVPEKPAPNSKNSVLKNKIFENNLAEVPKNLQSAPRPQIEPKPSSSQLDKKSKFFPYEKNFHVLPLIYSQNFGFSNYKDYGFISDLNSHRPGLKKQKKNDQARIGSCKSERVLTKAGKKLPKFSPYSSKMIEKQYVEHFCLDKDGQMLSRNSGGYVVNEKIRQLYMK